MKILAIIPARGGSKGIKDKNIIPVKGKPLIWYTINTAKVCLEQGIIDKLIISTDNQKIADICKEYKIEVPFLRPQEISTDKSKSIDFILHAIDYFENSGEFFDAVLLLQPTSPLRTFADLKDSIELFNNSKESSLISCYKEEYINDLVMYKYSIIEKKLIPLNSNHNKGVRRQEHGPLFVRNGSIYITRVEYLKKERKIISDFPLLHEMKKVNSINIDTLEDLDILRGLL